MQNIDLMNLAGFCRNCLSNWYREAAEAKGLPLSKEESREIVYGMPYDEWRAKYQAETSDAAKAAFEKNRPYARLTLWIVRIARPGGVDLSRAAGHAGPVNEEFQYGRKWRLQPRPAFAGSASLTGEAGTAASRQLKSLVERIERLEEEKKAIADDIRDVYRRGERARASTPRSCARWSG